MPRSRHLVLINTIANTFGLLTGPVLSLLLVPFYLHYLGLESYGLVGFFTALQLVLAVFSQGISMAMQREVARRVVSPESAPTLLRLVRSFELVYVGIGLLAAIGMISASGYLSHQWIQLHELDARMVQVALIFISARIAASFPFGLYQSVFIGTQRQVLGNCIQVSGAALSAAGVISAVLIWRNIAALYAAEALVTLILILTQRTMAYRLLPESNSGPRFALSEVIALWKLSAGLIWTSGTGVLLTQMDRILIGKWFPASSLAVYNAGTAGGKLVGMVYGPFLTAVYPETCRLAGSGNREALTVHFLRNAGIIASLCMSFGVFLCFFARDILWVWTRNDVITREGPVVMAIYIAGNIAHSYASVFYLIQTAKGSVRYPAWFNTAALIWYPLTMMALTTRWGIVGAAVCWLIYCSTTLILLASTSFYHFLTPYAWLHYIRTLLWTSLVGVGAMFGATWLIHLARFDSPWIRLMTGATAAVIVFMTILIGTLGLRASLSEFNSIRERVLKRFFRRPASTNLPSTE